MNKLIVYTLLAAVISSCQENASDRKDGFSAKPASLGDSLYHVVMEGHDVAMAKMGKLNKYKNSIQEKIDSLSKQAPGKKKILLDSLKSIHIDLAAAETAMNDWMERFDIDSAQSRSEAAVKYLEGQKDEVNAVKNRIIEAVAKADSLLKR